LSTATAEPAYVAGPSYLKSKRGGYLPVPKRIRDAFKCPECGAQLTKPDKLWVCPNALHGKAYSDGTLAVKLDEAIAEAGYKQIKGARVVMKQRRILRHLRQQVQLEAAREKVRKMNEERERLKAQIRKKKEERDGTGHDGPAGPGARPARSRKRAPRRRRREEAGPGFLGGQDPVPPLGGGGQGVGQAHTQPGDAGGGHVP
jgi:ribosomal protein L37AE/L43A